MGAGYWIGGFYRVDSSPLTQRGISEITEEQYLPVSDVKSLFDKVTVSRFRGKEWVTEVINVKQILEERARNGEIKEPLDALLDQPRTLQAQPQHI